MNNMDLLPELWEYIFTLCSSKTRSILCQVSTWCDVLALSVSRRLSLVSYDDNIEDDNLYASGDYHLIVRLKRQYTNMEIICRSGNVDVVQLLISFGVNDWNYGLFGACYGGHLELAELMMTNATNWNYGLQGACRGDHLELVNLILTLPFKKNWNWGLLGACRGGSYRLAELMISLGASDWNGGLHGACRGGHIELAELMILRGANNYNDGLWGACIGGHLKLAQLMVSHGATNWNYVLPVACRRGHINLVQLMISLGATVCVSCNKSISDH